MLNCFLPYRKLQVIGAKEPRLILDVARSVCLMPSASPRGEPACHHLADRRTVADLPCSIETGSNGFVFPRETCPRML